MPVITIDASRCDGDGACAGVCPRGLFTIAGSKAQLIPDAEELCISCGHCVAVCPRGAASLEGMSPKDCVPIESSMRLFPDAVEQFLMTRRSCRAYRDKVVSQETLEEMLDLARWAPSAVNRQAVSWIVFQTPESVREVADMVGEWAREAAPGMPNGTDRARLEKVVTDWEAGNDPICRGAPHLILAHGAPEVPLMVQDAAIALTYLELAAHGRGLGTCWAGFVTLAAAKFEALQKHLALPEGHAVLGGLMLGHPKYKHRRIPLRFEAQTQWR